MRLAFAVVAILTAASLPIAGTAQAAPRFARPAITENGSDLILFPYAGLHNYDRLEPVFAPNGDAYFVSSDLITRFSPDGTYATYSLPFEVAGPQTIYAHGMLWTGSYNGLVELSTDGKFHRETYLGGPIESIAPGNQGSVYAIAARYDSTTKVTTGILFRVGGSVPRADITLPVHPLGPLAFGADGLPYFSYVNDSTGSFGIARVESNGATTLFPIVGHGVGAQASYSLVSSNGYLYFTFIGDVPNGPGVQYAPQLFGRISQSGAITILPFPSLLSGVEVSTLSVDKGGNIWSILGPFGNQGTYGLFQFNVYTRRYGGPYVTQPVNSNLGPGPFVGPDDNIYFVLRPFVGLIAFAAYVSHVQTLEPATISLTSGKAVSFTILETHFNGPWTATSLNPAVADVTPPSSTTGDFFVTATGRGQTSIAVTDRLGNVSYEVVSSH